MSILLQSFSISNEQLYVELRDEPRYFRVVYRDLKKVSDKEYLDYITKCGEFGAHGKTGRLLADFSELQNYGISLRAVALNNIKATILDKMPYFLAAIVKSKSSFDNLAIEIALKGAKQLSRKFLDGKLFNNKEEAFKWLIEYPIPEEFLTNSFDS